MTFASATLTVQVQPDGRYLLCEPLLYQGKAQSIIVPAGFSTDFASVPRFLSALVPISGTWDRAAVVHDWLCAQLWIRAHGGKDMVPAVSPADADGLFRRMLRELGVPVVLRWLFWAGVRWGAAGSRARRGGWWRTAPALLGVSLLALPFVAPVAVVTAAALAVGGLLELVLRPLTR